jgi:ABC-type Fe3+/spermidine/putrescine transport system ATPase subunit
MIDVEFNKVTKYYNGKLAVQDFSLPISHGERIVILGHSGCGKTTVLRLLAGFITPDTGSIKIGSTVAASDGKNFTEPEDRNIAMVFQDLALWPHLTVKGNLEFGLKAKGIKRKERQERIEEILTLIKLEDLIHARVAELSGGQQQRVALARALVLNPKVLIMDEPLSSLDIELNKRLRQEIIRLQQQTGFSLLYVTHNLEEAFDMASYIVVMKDGRIRRKGEVKEVREYFNEILKTQYDLQTTTP